MERRVLQEFIEIYRSEPSLWKVRSPHYNNRAIKNFAYRRMVAKLREIYPSANLEMVKRKVNALRTNYRKELRKVEASREKHELTGEPVYVPSLWYFDLFQFIADDQEDEEEQPPSIIDVTAEDGSAVDMMRIYRRLDDDEDMSDEFEEEFQASSPESQKISNHNMRQMTSSYENNSHPPPFKRQRDFYKEAEEEEEQAQWYTKLQEMDSPPPDPQEVFGRYVASKLRNMDKSHQMLSERLISEVLFRGQMGLLSRKTCLSDEELPTTIKVEE